MDNNSKEQISSVPETPEANAAIVKDKTEGTSYGKFKTKEGLLEAYNALESEFTRRCQRIKELETQLSNRSNDEKWSKKVGELTEKYPVAKEMTAEIGEYIANNKDLLENEDCLEKALLAVLAARYSIMAKGNRTNNAAEEKHSPPQDAKLSLKQKAEAVFKSDAVPLPVPEILPQGGELPAAPRVRPKDLREAGEMARKLLNAELK
jgi:hypothetical protein